MMKNIFGFLSGLVLLTACNQHFITDATFRATVAEDLATRQEIMVAADIDLDEMGLATDEREALEFLYAYMPLGDMLNMTPEYYLDHYRMTKRALAQMPWGKNIPEREVRHFVFPIRVNNENLDSSRYVFYDELAPRIKNMTMRDAVLEVTNILTSPFFVYTILFDRLIALLFAAHTFQALQPSFFVYEGGRGLH